MPGRFGMETRLARCRRAPSHCGASLTSAPPATLSSSLTIMHALSPAPFGGLETVVSALARAQRAAGHRVVVAARMSSPHEAGTFIATLEEAGIDIQPLLIPNRAYVREGQLIRALCRDLGVNIVHTHGYRSDFVDGHAARSEGVPIVTTVHGFTGGGLRNRTYETLQRLAFRRFDAVVAVSRPMAARLRASGIAESRIHIVPNALMAYPSPLDRAAARRALNLPADEFIAGWVGRLSPEKGLDVFLEAIALLAPCGVRAAILGDGPERATQERRASERSRASIHWCGTVPDAARYLAAFDLLVLSSRTEGLPMVLLEAMASGLPIVTTRVGGIPDMLSDQEAILVPPDDARSLAAGIRAVLDDPIAAATRAESALHRQREEFAVGPWRERYESIYRSLLRGRTSVA